jgi:hypothetical protein
VVPVFPPRGWQRVTLTCAGISGLMRDGRWTHYGAAAQPYSRPYPWGTVVQLGDGSLWTIEDTLAPWISAWLLGRQHLDLYVAWGWSCQTFGVRTSAMRIRRWGWSGDWLRDDGTGYDEELLPRAASAAARPK